MIFMTDLQKLIEIFDSQKEKGIKSGDWPECQYRFKGPDHAGIRQVVLESQEIGFVFTKNGRFVGIYNWKD